MSPPDPKRDLDEKLAAFLQTTDNDVRQGHTIANLRLEIGQFNRRLRTAEAHIEVLQAGHDELRASQQEIMIGHEGMLDRMEGAEGVLEAHSKVLIHVKRRLRKDENDDEMATGTFDLKSIQREVEEQRAKRLLSERVKADETQWWKRTIIMWVAGALGFVAVSAITILITMAIANSSSGSRVQPPGQTSGQK